MPPFRVVARYPAKSHKDSVPATVGGVFDDREDVDEFLAAADEADLDTLQETNVSLPVEKRVRKRDHDQLAELQSLGYEVAIEELHVTEWGKDDAGQDVATAHEWKEVKE